MIAVDSGVLLRAHWPGLPESALCSEALEKAIHDEAEPVCSVQNLVEAWNVVTRPTESRGGLGGSIADGIEMVNNIRGAVLVEDDPPRLVDEWLLLAAQCEVKGVQVHDCRLAAWMRLHGIERILTLNPGDFSRYPGIVAMTPSDYVATE
jgi:predicted nucleic acid-binding protein